VEPSGLPLGYLVDHIDAGATPAERAEILAYAGAYTRRYLGVLLEHPQAVRFGWWSDWTPPGGLSRFSAIDRTGATEIGEGLLAALNAAPAPASRPAPAISRRYMLTNGLAADQWRAAIGGGRGMAVNGNGDGTKAEAGSGGAVLPLVLPVTPTPGDAPPPVWWDTTANAGAGGIVGYDPAAMALAMQWRSESVDGPILTLRNGAVVVAVLALAVGRITLTAGAVTRDLGAARNFAQSRIALSWAALSLSAAYHDGLTLAPEPAALTLASAPTNIVILGDGTATNTAVRGCVLEVFKDPLDLAGRATWAAPQGADVPSAAEILAG